LVVTVGKESGIGGRNQEFALAAALHIAGSKNTVIASIDTDGTDGPGFQFSNDLEGMPKCLAGGIVDGYTVDEARAVGIDINGELLKHNTSPALWTLKNGIVATPNISLNDLTVALVTR
jgi:glycerate-2-kinase